MADLSTLIPAIVGRAPRKIVFNHIQSVAIDTWTIVHNLGSAPVVQVLVDRPGQEERVEIEPEEIQIIDKNTTRIIFNRPESGLAQFIARSDAPPSIEQQQVTIGPQLTQISTSSLLTVATLDSDPASSIRLVFIDSSGNIFPVTFTVNYPPDTDSPWNQADTVVVLGKEYRVGTIDLNEGYAPGSPGLCTLVPTGSSFYYDETLYGVGKEVLLLLALPPYTNSDKITRKIYIPEKESDVGSITELRERALNTTGFVCNEVSVVDNLFRDVYPPVFIVE